MDSKNIPNELATPAVPEHQPIPTKKKIMGYGLIYAFASGLFRLGLIGLAITAAGVLTFGSSDAMKTALRDSGAYSQAANQLAERASQEATQAGGPSLESASVNSAAQDSISPELIQRDAEGAIDTTYDWLQGDTPKLVLSINLKPYIDSFTNKLGDQAIQKAEALPACTAAQLQQIDPNNIDVFNLPCRPPGLDLNTLKGQAIAKLTSSNELLSNPVIDTTSLPKDEQGKTALDKAERLPQVFQWIMILPWICLAAVVLGKAILLWLGWPDRWETLRKLARGILSAGITVLVFVALTKLLLWFTTKPNGIFSKLTEGSFSEVIISFARSLERVYDGKLLIFGIVYVVLGIAGIVGVRLVKKAELAKHSSNSLER